MKYRVELSLDLLEAILGLQNEGFKIMSIDVEEFQNKNPVLTLDVTDKPMQSDKVVEVDDFPLHSFGCGHTVPCWSAVRAIGEVKNGEEE